MKSVIVGKKSLGLWIDQWSDGVVDNSFSIEEILKEFSNKKIEIPKSFLLDFNNRIYKKKLIKFELEINRLRGK